MFFGGLTIAINGFSMVFLFFYHRFQWFSMVLDHWSNDAMVSMDRCGLDGGGGEASNIPELSSTWLYLLLMSIKKLKLQASF